MPAKAIIIVEDDQDVRETLKELLTLAGYEVTCAASANQALKIATTRNFAVAIVDLGLPDFSGIEVGKILARTTPRPYLIAYTGWGQKEHFDQTRQAGFDIHLVKPVPVDLLLDVIKRATASTV